MVGWFPLGPREVYVPGYRVSPAYVNRVNISNASVSTTTVTNVYNTTIINNVNTTQATKITYVNSRAPNAVTAVPQTSFTGGQPVASTAVALNQHQIAAARVTMRAEVAPTSASLVGPAVVSNHRTGTPPPAVLNRPVVAKVAPPPPPVPFERQQAALAQHPGQPLARNEVETLRTTDGPQTHPLVRSVTEPASAESRGNQSKGQPNLQVGNTQSSSRELESRPVSATSPGPQRKEPLSSAPPSVFPSYSAPASNQASRPANPGPAHEQSTGQPIHERVSYRPAPSESEPTAPPSKARSVQPSTAFPGPPVSSSSAEPSGNAAPAPPPRPNGNSQPTESVENGATVPPSKARSVQPSTAFPGPPVSSSSAEPRGNAAPAPPPRPNGNSQPTESKVTTAPSSAPATRKASPPHGDATDQGKDKKK